MGGGAGGPLVAAEPPTTHADGHGMAWQAARAQARRPKGDQVALGQSSGAVAHHRKNGSCRSILLFFAPALVTPNNRQTTVSQ